MSFEAAISTWKLTKKQVRPTEKFFLLSCADRAGENGICWPSIKRLCADTGLDRKTIIRVRQSVIEKGLMEYTGNMRGRSQQIPEMRLTYVDHRCEDDLNSPKNGTGKKSTSPKNGTSPSPKNGTGDQSQKRDTESISIEPKKRTNTHQATPVDKTKTNPKPEIEATAMPPEIQVEMAKLIRNLKYKGDKHGQAELVSNQERPITSTFESAPSVD